MTMISLMMNYLPAITTVVILETGVAMGAGESDANHIRKIDWTKWKLCTNNCDWGHDDQSCGTCSTCDGKGLVLKPSHEGGRRGSFEQERRFQPRPKPQGPGWVPRRSDSPEWQDSPRTESGRRSPTPHYIPHDWFCQKDNEVGDGNTNGLWTLYPQEFQARIEDAYRAWLWKGKRAPKNCVTLTSDHLEETEYYHAELPAYYDNDTHQEVEMFFCFKNDGHYQFGARNRKRPVTSRPKTRSRSSDHVGWQHDRSHRRNERSRSGTPELDHVGWQHDRSHGRNERSRSSDPELEPVVWQHNLSHRYERGIPLGWTAFPEGAHDKIEDEFQDWIQDGSLPDDHRKVGGWFFRGSKQSFTFDFHKKKRLGARGQWVDIRSQ